MFKKACPRGGGGPSSPVLSRVEGKCRSPFYTWRVLSVREHERREERQVCEPEGPAKWRHLPVRAVSAKPGNVAGSFFQHSPFVYYLG